MSKHRILLVHNNKQEFSTLKNFLGAEDFEVNAVADEIALEENLGEFQPDLIMLPVELSSKSGIELCEEIKQKQDYSDIFIVLLSQKKEDHNLIAGLESGADDFLFQPVHERVLLSRLKALLKRRQNKIAHKEETALIIDQDRYLIIAKGVEYYLPKKEFEILSLLNSRPSKVFSRDEIKNAIWDNFEKVRGRTVDVHIRKIREKIGAGLITTVKGVGYRLEAN